MIDRLIIFAGPSNAGKTTLIGSWGLGSTAEFDQALDVTGVDGWQILTMEHVRSEGHPDYFGSVLFEVNLNWVYLSDTPIPEVPELRHVVAQAREISLVTLISSQKRLLRNCEINWVSRLGKDAPSAIQRAPIKALGGFSRLFALPDFAPGLSRGVLRMATLIGGGRGPRWWRLYGEFYRQPARIRDCYDQWFGYCDGLTPAPIHDIIVEYEDSLSLYSREEWARVIRDP